MAVNCPLIAFLCLASALLTAGAVVKNDQVFYKGCPVDWTAFGTRCFKFFDAKLTWSKAERSCLSVGAHLASIHSSEENDFLLKLIFDRTQKVTRAWVGGHDAFQERTWTWTDGSAWNYAKWQPGQPDNAGGREHFLELNYRPGWDWNDFFETASLNYICAKDLAEEKSVSQEVHPCTCAPNCFCHQVTCV